MEQTFNDEIIERLVIFMREEDVIADRSRSYNKQNIHKIRGSKEDLRKGAMDMY